MGRKYHFLTKIYEVQRSIKKSSDDWIRWLMLLGQLLRRKENCEFKSTLES
jgi:hypothetical protein